MKRPKLEGTSRIVRVKVTETAFNLRTGKFDGATETRIVPVEFVSAPAEAIDRPKRIRIVAPLDREKHIAERRAQIKLVKTC
jgi:hypothetical protein